MKTWYLFLAIFLSANAFADDSNTVLNTYKKIFSEPGEIIKSECKIFLHEGNNVWYQIDEQEKKYERLWKCPYCYRFYPYGQKCTNPSCPTNCWIY